MSDRYCEYEECGALLVRHENEQMGTFKSRRFCSRKCANSNRECYLPTPVEIAAECDKIREGWAEDDSRRRNSQESRTANALRKFYVRS